MKKRMLMVLLVIGVGVVGSNITGISNIRTENSTITPLETKPQEDPPGTINGATNPELIPDRTAYILLFRLISNRQTDEARGRIRAYIRQMGLGKPCCNQNPLLGTEEADIDALIAAAEEFYGRISVLDSQAKEIRNRVKGSLSEETRGQLKQLQRQKEQIVDEIVASLQKRVSKTGVDRIKSHIRERVKPQVKYTAP